MVAEGDADISIQSPEICVICLDLLHQRVTAIPCGHDQFDVVCLHTWSQHQPVCPLCKTSLAAIEYYDGGKVTAPKVLRIPIDGEGKYKGNQATQNRLIGRRTRSFYRGRHTNVRLAESDATSSNQEVLEVRRMVYQHSTPSLYIGTNSISRYRNLTPSLFEKDPHLIARARMFIRRELSAFDFLDPTSASFGRIDRRASNAEYLLEYIVSILKSIDLKGSAGQATELLKDFLGREHARLFWHELEAWLRSPYAKLEDWDRQVQY